MTNRGFTLWFTGLSGAGKSTLAEIIEQKLKDRGRYVEVLDGDIVRTNLSKGLGFSKEDRDTNIRRIGFVAHLLSRNGVAAITAAISPYRDIRDECRAMIGNFVEVYVKCPVSVCADRDVKGLYAKAIAGEIPHFTGVSDPYEEPENAEIVVETDLESKEASADKIIARLEELGYLDPVASSCATAGDEDDELVRQRLEELGYV
ncbi:MAG: adenylyl-sulfate kinase [Acidobacteria bacterium]|nr:adenylyl-sulfate kinase [Acidobacteriota bacterium]